MNDDKRESIFLAARRIQSRGEREAFLDRACADEPELRAWLERMLASKDEADSYFADGAATLNPDSAPDPEPSALDLSAEMGGGMPGEHPGDVIGRYKLLQKLGEGGFGSVWMAEQTEPVIRRVALKVIKAGMDTAEVIARFEAERQALAMMEHPNIAKVYDAGATRSGRPYFVMELVRGVPVTEFCDSRRLGTDERLALFTDVCGALNHAHQKGIIHRDLKPANILITLHGDRPVPKIIDFGIAKAIQQKLTEKTLFTRFEQFIGTPAYMSPEQAGLSGLDIDTRSDIYALGVLLYELLTGKPPFDAQSLAAAGYDEMRRIIREEEPPRPSTRLVTMARDERSSVAAAHHTEPDKLNKLVRGDLDLIDIELDESHIAAPAADEKLLEVHEAIDQLAAAEPFKAEVVKLRFFVGWTNTEIATALGVNEKTVRRHWTVAKVILYSMIKGAGEAEDQ